MLRFKKPVKLLEWGEGTNTLNQVWTEIGQGSFVSRTVKDGVTSLVIEIKGALNRKNENSSAVKLCQLSEGMAANSQHWGEVAMGYLASVENQGGSTKVVVTVPTALKISDAAGVIGQFLNIP